MARDYKCRQSASDSFRMSEGETAWVAYYEALAAGDSRHELNGLYWQAHQVSLHAGIEAARGFELLEPEEERNFIDLVTSNADAAALAGVAACDDFVANAMTGFLEHGYGMEYPAEGVDDMIRLNEMNANLRYPFTWLGVDSMFDWGGDPWW